MLTGARIRAALTCREVGGEVWRQFVGGSRGGVDAEGFRDSWAPRVDSWSSCDEAKGVREVGNPPAARKRAAGKNSPERGPAKFRRSTGLGPRQRLQEGSWHRGNAPTRVGRGSGAAERRGRGGVLCLGQGQGGG